MKENRNGRQTTLHVGMTPVPSQSIHHLFSLFQMLGPVAGGAWDNSSLRRYTTQPTYLHPVYITSQQLSMSASDQVIDAATHLLCDPTDEPYIAYCYVGRC